MEPNGSMTIRWRNVRWRGGYGIIVWQEQVVQLITDVTGLTAAQADEIRRAFAKSNNEHLIALHWERFREGARAAGAFLRRRRGGFLRRSTGITCSPKAIRMLLRSRPSRRPG